MHSQVKSFGLNGLIGHDVKIEADLQNGLPKCLIVGLADAAVKEAKDRVRSAIKNSNFRYPQHVIVVNLAPADIKKEGALYDLPIAVGILAAQSLILPSALEKYIILGELSLGGDVQHVEGVLPMLISAREIGYKNFIVPHENGKEARFVTGINVYPVKSLRETVDFLNGSINITPFPSAGWEASQTRTGDADIKYIKGQLAAKRALEIAVAGGHNILFIGPPGTGKTMLARAAASIMPELSFEEALETAKIHCVAGQLEDGFIFERPFRSPHHSASLPALCGGGTKARPGEISLAHNGILFLDELPEYSRHTLESLRQPIEDGIVTISRAAATVAYPANFMLIASMNPCPCGNYGSSTNPCICSAGQVHKYLAKLSGPLFDRIDIQIEVDNVTFDALTGDESGESSMAVRQRVNAARTRQKARFVGQTGKYTNAQMSQQDIKDSCGLDSASSLLLQQAFEKLKMSARGHNRILKVARTIADLAGEEKIKPAHIAEALQYRSLDRKYRL